MLRATGIWVRAEDGRAYVWCRDGTITTYARAVAAGKLRRLLTPREVVHHLNSDQTDDRPENLEVLPSQREHVRRHGHSWRTSRWSDRKCRGCGCDHDERTAGCRQCGDRHNWRKRKAAA